MTGFAAARGTSLGDLPLGREGFLSGAVDIQVRDIAQPVPLTAGPDATGKHELVVEAPARELRPTAMDRPGTRASRSTTDSAAPRSTSRIAASIERRVIDGDWRAMSMRSSRPPGRSEPPSGPAAPSRCGDWRISADRPAYPHGLPPVWLPRPVNLPKDE